MRKRRLPKYLKVVGVRIPIYLVPDLTHADEHGHEAPAFGVYYPTAQVVELASDMGHERRKNTLVHEALHAMVNAAQLEIEHDDEEKLVGRLAPVVLDFLRSNRGAIAYLQEDLV